jgi:predicted MFS family arabinose efflux permease
VTFLWVGAVFGAIDVSVVAFTEARGQAAAAGPVLALFALGSLVSGVVYGARHSTMSDGRRLQVAVVLLAAGAGSLVLVSGLVTLAVVAPVVGVTVAPLLIAGNAFVRLAVPPGRLTEGLAWVSTSLGIGVALGAAVSGWVIDAMGAHRGFTITLMAGFLALISVLAGRRWLEPR